MSDRERAVLALVAEGRSNAGIAAELFLSPQTVESDVATVFTKLGLASASAQVVSPHAAGQDAGRLASRLSDDVISSR